MLNGKTQPHVGEIDPEGKQAGTSPAWFRIGETQGTAAKGAAALLALTRIFATRRTEAFALAVAIAYDQADVKPLASSFYSEQHYLTKVRVCFDANQGGQGKSYIDVRYESNTNNPICATAFGGIRIYDPADWVKDPPTDGMTIAEFEI